MKVIRVPTINDQPHDFERLFRLWNQVNEDSISVKFDFSQCGFLRQNAVAFLGGLARMIEYRRGNVTFDWDTLQIDVKINLAKNGFLAAFGYPSTARTGNAIPYREDLEREKSTLMEYLKMNWLGRGWVHVSPLLRDAIVGVVWEIYENAFEHSQSPVGVFSCGQHYPKQRQLKLSVVDFGVGIPSNVRVFARNSQVPAAAALKWAFMAGTTTKANGTRRGLGLDLLKEFVKVNRGRLDIYSHDGYAVLARDQESYLNREYSFEGTLVNITLQCDESYYHFTSEVEGLLF